jgi:hypothetical protein
MAPDCPYCCRRFHLRRARRRPAADDPQDRDDRRIPHYRPVQLPSHPGRRRPRSYAKHTRSFRPSGNRRHRAQVREGHVRRPGSRSAMMPVGCQLSARSGLAGPLPPSWRASQACDNPHEARTPLCGRGVRASCLAGVVRRAKRRGAPGGRCRGRVPGPYSRRGWRALSTGRKRSGRSCWSSPSRSTRGASARSGCRLSSGAPRR